MLTKPALAVLAGSFLGAAVASFSLSATPAPETTSLRELHLVDRNGKVRATFTTSDVDAAPSLTLMDRNGTIRMKLGLEGPRETAFLLLEGDDGNIVKVSMEKNLNPRIVLYKGNKPIWTAP